MVIFSKNRMEEESFYDGSKMMVSYYMEIGHVMSRCQMM